MINEIRNFKLWDFEERKEIELSFKKAGDHRWKALCCFHVEKHESLYYYDLTESYYCFGCGRSGISYEKYLRYIEALKPYNLVESLGDPVASYPYRDEEGKLLYQKYRFEKRNEKGELEKTYRLWRPDSKGGIIRNIQGVRRVLYNLDKINNSGDKVIFLLEGEKDCDNLMTKFEGILATTSDIGAGKGIKKWRPEYYDFFQDRNIIIIPDNDKISRVFYRDIGNTGAGIAKSIKWLILPGLKEHGDITDWLMQGGTLEELFKLIEKAPEFPLPVPIQDRAIVDLDEIMKAELPKKEQIIGSGIMPQNGYTLIASKAKRGKTLFSFDMALDLISGNQFLETFKINGKYKVLYIFSETDINDIQEVMDLKFKGLAELGINIPEEDKKNLRTYNIEKELLSINLKNDDLTYFQKVIDDFKPDVIIIDPIGRICTFDMNKDFNITLFTNLMIQIRDCHWVLVHHTRKESAIIKRASKSMILDKDAVFDSIRGSSCWENYAKSIIALVPSGDDTPENYLKVFFRLKKGFEAEPLEVKWDLKYLNYELIDITDLHKKIRINYDDMMDYIKRNFGDKKYKYRGLTTSLSQKFRVTPQRVGQLILQARDNGDMVKDEGKFGKWYIPGQGEIDFESVDT